MIKVISFLLLFSLPAAALEGGASTDKIKVQADFSGAELTLFGALDRDIVKRDKIFILVEGPKKTVALWQKQSVAGVWVNGNKKLFENVGGFYFLGSNKAIDKTQRNEVLKNIGKAQEKEKIERLLTKRNLFYAMDGKVEILGKRLFKVKINLPRTAPIGKYSVRIMHFSANKLIKQIELPLVVNRTGWGQRLVWLAQEWAFFYGLFAVVFALLIGWSITELLRRLS